jgi:hypothetical protein
VYGCLIAASYRTIIGKMTVVPNNYQPETAETQTRVCIGKIASLMVKVGIGQALGCKYQAPIETIQESAGIGRGLKGSKGCVLMNASSGLRKETRDWEHEEAFQRMPVLRWREGAGIRRDAFSQMHPAGPRKESHNWRWECWEAFKRMLLSGRRNSTGFGNGLKECILASASSRAEKRKG